MLREENLVLTYAGGNEFLQQESFWVYVNTLSVIPDSDKVIITHEMPDLVRDRLLEKGFIIEDVPLIKYPYLLRDRHLAFWEYLNEHGHKYKYVAICDSKDVLFQRSPFHWIEEWKHRFDEVQGNKAFLSNFVILTSEGFRQSQSGFARIEDFEFQRDVPPQFFKEDSDRWVVNGGVTLGTPQALQNHEFLIWSVAMKTIGRCTDQATLNYLMNFLEEDATYSISQPTNDTLCLHGEGVKEGFVKEPTINNGVFESSYLGVPYCIVHQWDRLNGHLKECALSHSAD